MGSRRPPAWYGHSRPTDARRGHHSRAGNDPARLPCRQPSPPTLEEGCAEADGNRTRQGVFTPSPVLKTGEPTRHSDASLGVVKGNAPLSSPRSIHKTGGEKRRMFRTYRETGHLGGESQCAGLGTGDWGLGTDFSAT